MKSIKEKAKAYDEAIKRAQAKMEEAKVFDYDDEQTAHTIRLTTTDIFPELKESEDERIINRIKKAVEEYWSDEPLDEIFAWLEKQAEHANFRNKIQIGDKVTRNEDGVLINLSQLKRVAKKDEKQGGQKPTIEMKSAEESLGIDSETYNKIVDECIYGEKKPIEWSEEDETTKNNISHIIRQYDKISKRENQPCYYVGDCLLWMQNIKDRVQPQPKQEWSEEMEVLNEVIRNPYLSTAEYNGLIALREQLKAL